MSAFATKTFNAANYASLRPTYPQKLYDLILAYHKGARNQGLDLGCGHGVVARQFGNNFKQFLCTDPSERMLEQARTLTPKSEYPGVSYLARKAEDDVPLPAGSVDIVTSAEACHWFDQPRLYALLRGKVRSGGTLAFWGYKDHVFVDFPKANDVLDKYVYGDDPETLGPYWEAGRQILRANLKAIQPPVADWEEIERHEYEPSGNGSGSGQGTLLMNKRTKVGQVKEYMRTWSSFHGWEAAHEGATARVRGGQGDVIDRMFDEMAAAHEYMADEDNEVEIEWGSALILARRR